MDTKLQQFTEQQIAVITPFEARSRELAAVADKIVVGDDVALKLALQLKRELTAHVNHVKDVRLELTRPLDAVSKELISREREIVGSAETAKSSLIAKIQEYEEQQERLRREEQARVQAIANDICSLYTAAMTAVQVENGRKKAKVIIAGLSADDREEPRIKVALLELNNWFTGRMNDIDAEANRAAKKKLEDDQTKIDNEKRRVEAEARRQAIEKQQIAADLAAKAEEAGRPKSNTREEIRFEIFAPDSVPMAFCSPDERKIRRYIQEVKAAGEELRDAPGIRFYTEKVTR